MSMTAGSVTVADDESVTGDGLARALYDADVATLALPTLPTLGATAAPWTASQPVTQAAVDIVQAGRLQALREAARRANAYAAATVAYVTAHAVVRVTSQSLGRTPDPNNADTAIQPPAAPVELPIF